MPPTHGMGVNRTRRLSSRAPDYACHFYPAAQFIAAVMPASMNKTRSVNEVWSPQCKDSVTFMEAVEMASMNGEPPEYYSSDSVVQWRRKILVKGGQSSTGDTPH